MSSHRLDGSSTESHFLHPTAIILLPRTRFAIITGINYTIQNHKGEFIIKRINTKTKQSQLEETHYQIIIRIHKHSLIHTHSRISHYPSH